MSGRYPHTHLRSATATPRGASATAVNGFQTGLGRPNPPISAWRTPLTHVDWLDRLRTRISRLRAALWLCPCKG